MYTVESNTLKIIHLFINSSYHLSLEDITKGLNIKKRNAYYEVEKFNNLLNDLSNAPCLCDEQGRYYLSDQQQLLLKKLLKDKGYNLIFNKKEREHLIVLQLMLIPKVTVNMIADNLHISRSTTLKELKQITNDYPFIFSTSQGYKFNGNLSQALVLFFNTCAKIDHHLFEVNTKILQQLNTLQMDLDIYFVNNQAQALALLIENIELFYQYPNTSYQPAHFLYDYFDLNEQQNKILSAGLAIIRSSLIQNSNYDCQDIAKKLIINFQQISMITLDSVDVLTERLSNHLNSAIYRYEKQISIENILLDDIKNNYGDIFEYVKVAVEQLDMFDISDDEIAFLTMHFLAVIKPYDLQNSSSRILIICNCGLASSNILANEVHELLGQDAIVEITKYKNSTIGNYDLVLSTIPLDVDNYLLVKPILSDYDKINILNRLGCAQQLSIPKIMQIASKYMSTKNYQAFEKEVYHLKDQKYSVNDYKNQFRRYKNSYTYQQAIEEIGQILLSNNSIELEYLDEIESLIDELGDYMFVADNIVLAHASLKHTNKMDMAIGVFDNPVTFKNKQAKIIILLACNDQNSHLGLIKELRLMIKNKTLEDYLKSSV